MIAYHRRNLERVGKVKTFLIFLIHCRSSQTIGDVYDFEFSLVSKIWDGQETMKSPIVCKVDENRPLGYNKIAKMWNLFQNNVQHWLLFSVVHI